MFASSVGTRSARADAVEPVVWEQRTDALRGPPARAGGNVVVYDTARKKLVLFGGWGAMDALGDTWEWDATNGWQQKTPAHNPAPRFGHCMAFDEARGRVVMMGGYLHNAVDGLDSDHLVWEWDGVDWKAVTAPGAPAPSDIVRGGATYDSMHKRTVIVGSSATYTWDGMSWTSYSYSTIPILALSGRFIPADQNGNQYSALVTYDRVRGVTVVLASKPDGVSSKFGAWEWDGGSWTFTEFATTSPFVSPSSVFFFDPLLGKSVLIGGPHVSGLSSPSTRNEVWSWDGHLWQQIGTTPWMRVGASAAFDTDVRRILLFGGADPAITNDLWSWEGVTWIQLVANTSPGLTLDHAVAYDEHLGVTTMFGGVMVALQTASQFSNRTWVYDGARWERRLTGVAPSGRSQHRMVYDAARARIVLFGGQTGWDTSSQLLNETWEWDGSTWWQRDSVSAPSARTATAMAYDRDRKVTVLFGGLLGPNSVGGDTWEWDGSAWTQRTPFQSPPARAWGALAWDPQNHRVVLFGGTNRVTEFSDIWDWDGMMWVQRTSASPISARSNIAFAGHEVRGTMVLYGGGANETWELTKNAANLQNLTPAPGPQHASSSNHMVYDRARVRMVLYEGQGAEDTWEYHASGASCSENAQCDQHLCINGKCKSIASMAISPDASVQNAVDAGIVSGAGASQDASPPADPQLALDASLPFDAAGGATSETSEGGMKSAHDDSGCGLKGNRAEGLWAWTSLLLALATQTRRRRDQAEV